MLGTSSLRRMLVRSGYTPHFAEQLGAAVVLVGRLVDVAANLTDLAIYNSDENRERFRELEPKHCRHSRRLVEGKDSRVPIACATGVSPAAPLLSEMERTVCLIPEVFASSQPLSTYASTNPGSGDPPFTLFVRDAWSNPEHIKFAMQRAAWRRAYATSSTMASTGRGSALQSTT